MRLALYYFRRYVTGCTNLLFYTGRAGRLDSKAEICKLQVDVAVPTHEQYVLRLNISVEKPCDKWAD